MERKSPRGVFVVLAAFFAFRVTAAGAEFYAAPSGSPSGNGSVDRPWDLATALAHPAAVRPGDTIWLRGGTYRGSFISALAGTPAAPIKVRQYPGERSIVDGNSGGNAVTLVVNGSYTWYWDFEVTNSDPTRISPTIDNPARRGEGVNVFGVSNKLINIVIHDTAQGVLTTSMATGDTEVYGCLIYYNGYDAPDRGHGHGLYVQNQTGTKRIVDNILFEQFGYGIHAYTEGGTLDNLYFEGNTSFNNGGLSRVSGFTTNFLVGASGTPATSCTSSTKVAQKPTLVGNCSYYPQEGPGGLALNLGYSKGTCDPTVRDNYFASGGVFNLVNAFGVIRITGNTFYGALLGVAAADYPSNNYYTARPIGSRVFVRRNSYEAGRANIVIYNWDGAASVGVDLTGVLTVGSRYEIRNAQDYFGPPVKAGTFTGGLISLPMTGLSVAKPVGWPAPTATGPEFNAFVVLTTLMGRLPVAPVPTRPGTRSQPNNRR